jgi:hypothetical protein
MLGYLLSAEGRDLDCVQQMRQGAPPVDDDDRNKLRVTIMRLMALKKFASALEVWRLTHPTRSNPPTIEIVNGDFIDPILRDDPGFGWQLNNVPSMSAVVDTDGPTKASHSLRIEFNGEPPRAELVSQIVVAEPETRYALHFVARATELVSGGLPVLVARGIDSEPAVDLGRSTPIGAGSSGWVEYELDFTTSRNGAVEFSLEREPCKESPCPIFGKLWLSHFSLTKRE